MVCFKYCFIIDEDTVSSIANIIITQRKVALCIGSYLITQHLYYCFNENVILSLIRLQEDTLNYLIFK